MQITVSQYVDTDVDLDDIDTDDLAQELIKRNNYNVALYKALKVVKSDHIGNNDFDEIKELVDAFRMQKPVGSIIESIAYKKYGLVC